MPHLSRHPGKFAQPSKVPISIGSKATTGTRTPKSSGALIARTWGSSASPTKLHGVGVSLHQRGVGTVGSTYMVDTPASMEDDNVNAEDTSLAPRYDYVSFG